MTSPVGIRICIGAHHQPDCHHRAYMRQGVEEFLASDAARSALLHALGEPAAGAPEVEVERVLAYLAAVAETDELERITL